MNPAALIKGFLVQLTCPFFFREVGVGARCFGRIRWPLPLRNIRIGKKCMIGDSVYFHTGRRSKISIGHDCSINTGSHLVASDSIQIGNNVAIAEYVSIRDNEHKFDVTTGVRGQGFKVAPIEIGDNCWIGRGVYIGPGVKIGPGTIVAANSVVRSGDYPPNVLLGGAPAVIKKRL